MNMIKKPLDPVVKTKRIFDWKHASYSLGGASNSLLELNNDHGAIDGYPQDMFIDY